MSAAVPETPVHLHLRYGAHEGDAVTLSVEVRGRVFSDDTELLFGLGYTTLHTDDVQRHRTNSQPGTTMYFPNHPHRNEGLKFALGVAEALGFGAVRVHAARANGEGQFAHFATSYSPRNLL
jgi:hypothetical protein